MAVPSVASPRNLVSGADAPAGVLGSRTVEMSATHASIIRGTRAFRLAQAVTIPFPLNRPCKICSVTWESLRIHSALSRHKTARISTQAYSILRMRSMLVPMTPKIVPDSQKLRSAFVCC